MKEYIGITSLQPRNAEDCQEPPEAGRGKEGSSPEPSVRAWPR